MAHYLCSSIDLSSWLITTSPTLSTFLMDAMKFFLLLELARTWKKNLVLESPSFIQDNLDLCRALIRLNAENTRIRFLVVCTIMSTLFDAVASVPEPFQTELLRDSLYLPAILMPKNADCVLHFLRALLARRIIFICRRLIGTVSRT